MYRVPPQLQMLPQERSAPCFLIQSSSALHRSMCWADAGKEVPQRPIPAGTYSSFAPLPSQTPSTCKLQGGPASVRLSDPSTLTQVPAKGCPMAFLSLRPPSLFWEQGRKAYHPSGKSRATANLQRGKDSIARGRWWASWSPGFRVQPSPRLSPAPCQLCGLEHVIWPF